MARGETGFWLQLFLSTLLPLVLGGGGLFFLTELRDRFPEWLYAVLVFALWLVVIAILARLAFTLLFKTIWAQVRHRVDRGRAVKNIERWYARWQLLTALLHELKRDGWQCSPEHEERYHDLRQWFIEHRSPFLPEWGRFYHSRVGIGGEENDTTVSLRYKVFSQNYGDPFSYFYGQQRLSRVPALFEPSWADEEKQKLDDIPRKLTELLVEAIAWRRIH